MNIIWQNIRLVAELSFPFFISLISAKVNANIKTGALKVGSDFFGIIQNYDLVTHNMNLQLSLHVSDMFGKCLLYHQLYIESNICSENIRLPGSISLNLNLSFSLREREREWSISSLTRSKLLQHLAYLWLEYKKTHHLESRGKIVLGFWWSWIWSWNKKCHWHKSNVPQTPLLKAKLCPSFSQKKLTLMISKYFWPSTTILPCDCCYWQWLTIHIGWCCQRNWILVCREGHVCSVVSKIPQLCLLLSLSSLSHGPLQHAFIHFFPVASICIGRYNETIPIWHHSFSSP